MRFMVVLQLWSHPPLPSNHHLLDTPIPNNLSKGSLSMFVSALPTEIPQGSISILNDVVNAEVNFV